MGAGRRSQTIAVTASSGSGSGGGNLGPPRQRNLAKGELGAVIFGCTNSTMGECLNQNLFGLPSQHFRYVKHIEAGMPLFLFNYGGRTMHGIFEATCDGALNINPNAWQADKTSRTPFPAQVKFSVRQKCSPLIEAVFKEAISDNYFSTTHFMFELTHTQKDHLLSLFLQNMQTPLTKSPAPKSTTNSSKLGTQKAVKKSVEVDNDWPQPTTTTTDLSSEWRIKTPPKLERGVTSTTAEEELENFQQLGTEDEIVSADGFYKYSQKYDVLDLYITGSSKDSAATNEPSLYSTIELDKNEQSHAINGVGKMSNKDLDKAARQRSILEKLQRLDPSRADISQESQNISALEKKQPQVLNVSSQGDAQQQLPPWQTELSKNRNENSQINMATEITALKQEINNLRLHNERGPASQTGNGTLETSSIEVSSRTHLLGGSVQKSTTFLQREIYILGGLADTWLESVLVFSPATNQMRGAAPMLAPRSYAAASLLDSNIYLYGGGDGSSWSDSAECYSITTGRWEVCAPMRLKRGSLGGATVGNCIYAMGGGNGLLHFNEVECYEPVLGTWIPSTKMLEKRFCVAATELNGAIYALGGFNGEDYLRSVERFDPREGLWTQIPAMGSKRGSLSATVLNGKLYALGGFDGTNFLNTVEIFDPRGHAWMPGLSMTSKRAYGAAVVLDDALYVLGGMEDIQTKWWIVQIERFVESRGWEDVAHDAVKNRSFVAAAVL
ncbi:unnamed protein product [Sphagnum jensenii]|uniref:DCD domain-containing protein n=1 Tax=Sphagnum jensenii TaxID=128206 RepID=A0ABP0WX45_9BRYO